MKQMVDEGALGVRLWVMVREGNEAEAPTLAQYRTIDYGDGHLTVRAIKRQIDGALGSRGAWLLEPYADKPDSTGLNTTSVDSIRETARLAIANGYQLCVHAIGDRANRETLTSSRRRSRRTPTRRICAGASSTRSTSALPTSRASASSASSRRCRASTARRTRRTCPRGSATGAPRKAPTSGRS